jgi:hypothetical protein
MLLSSIVCLLLLQPPRAGETLAAEPAPAPGEQAPEDTGAGRRAELNLLGETNSAAGESRRNENVQFNLIDNNARRDLNMRLGPTATLVREFDAERNYFSTEYGNSPSSSLHNPRTPGDGIHGQLFYRHLNSIFSARSFFQVGEVQPARENEYGFGLAFPLWRGARLFAEASQRKLRGQVNGNVQVPTLEERVPLTTEPALRAFVQSILDAYPAAAPNRPDIDARMLNTNSPQTINGDNASMKLDQSLSPRDNLFAGYQFIAQQVTAFQLIRGQNPDTTTRSHRARLTWSRTFSPRAVFDLTTGFDRTGILIVPERNHTGPSVFISGGALTTINGSTQVPIDRAQNEFRQGARLRLVRGPHTFTLGGDILRRQLNGFDSDNHLGTYAFRANFGNDPITNLRLGLPTTHFRGVGVIARGYRTWDMNWYAGDEWRLRSNLTVSLGLRWRPVTAPVEVNAYERFPYSSDWNNFAPQAGLAWRAAGGVLRASWGLFFGEIFPATYQQARFNPPWNYKLIINDPDPLNPLSGLAGLPQRGTLYAFSNDLVSPYSNLYGLSWERALSQQWSLQLGWVGSRTNKLLLHWYENRARIVPGIPTTTATINDRRPDPRYLDVRRVVNSGRAWYDAARVSLNARAWRGFTLEMAYWLSKNIDTGTDYLNTAYDSDSFRGMSQSEDPVNEDLRGLSRFDQPHAFLTRFTYTTPRAWKTWWRGWELGSIVLLKSGTPFNVISGADSPGLGNVDGANGDRPHLLDPSILGRTIGHPDSSLSRLPRSAFAFMQPEDGRGSLGRNTFRRGGIYNVNASLQRSWRANGDFEFRLRGESVNLLNTPQFAEPGNALADPNFARITNTLNEGRTFRFEAAFRF